MTNPKTIYTVGGTVQAGGGIYIERAADRELLELCRAGELTFILSSRQVGKSSLMVRTSEELEKENICSAIVDLSAIGVSVTPDEWYLGILNEIAITLELECDIFAWWSDHAGLSPAKCLSNFFRDVLLVEVKERVVLFFDEIDSTLSIPFSDDFFAAIRAIYNARSTTPDFMRLSTVFLGVAAPGDLISDSKRTPFNIGRRVELCDFTPEEAKPLANGLGENAIQALTWVFDWTGGHPYLTQRLCAHLSKREGTLSIEAVDAAVEELFLGEGGRQDNNLQFVRDMLTHRAPDAQRLLPLYKKICSGRKVTDDEHSITKSHLKLSGVVRSENGHLQVRNKIYATAFNIKWVQDVTPKNLTKTAAIVFGSLTVVLLSIFVYDFVVGSMSTQYTGNFYTSRDPSEKLRIMANIFNLEGILQNADYDFRARELFYSLTWDEQIDLFDNTEINLSDKQKFLPVAIKGLYVTFANIEGGQDSSELLRVMAKALDDVETLESVNLQAEIEHWLEARDAETDQLAFDKYSEAIQKSPDNPATRYERARVALKMGLYEHALLDLDATMALAQNISTDAFEQEIATPTEWPTKINASATNTPVYFTQIVVPSLSLTQNISTSTPIVPSETIITPLPPENPALTEQANPYRVREGYKSSFYSIAYIRSAIALVLQRYSGTNNFDFNSAIYNNRDNLPSLVDSGLVYQNPMAIIESLATATSLAATQTAITSFNGQDVNLIPGSSIVHQVVEGEWLWQIARCYGADPRQIINENPQTDLAKLSAGIVLVIPNVGSIGTIYGPPCIGYHTVQSGDTWNSIAQFYNADISSLQEVNPGELSVGRILKVPINSALPPTSTTSQTLTPTSIPILGYGKLTTNFFPLQEPNGNRMPNDLILYRRQFVTVVDSTFGPGGIWYKCIWEINGEIGEGWILEGNIEFVPPPTSTVPPERLEYKLYLICRSSNNLSMRTDFIDTLNFQDTIYYPSDEISVNANDIKSLWIQVNGEIIWNYTMTIPSTNCIEDEFTRLMVGVICTISDNGLICEETT